MAVEEERVVVAAEAHVQIPCAAAARVVRDVVHAGRPPTDTDSTAPGDPFLQLALVQRPHTVVDELAPKCSVYVNLAS